MCPNDIFSKLEPDVAGQILQTRFLSFESDLFRIDGLMRENGAGQIELMAVSAREPGKGQFRRFIRRLKHLYTTICVWHIENPSLEAALGRYGFTPEETVDEFGDKVTGRRWDSARKILETHPAPDDAARAEATTLADPDPLT